MPDVRQPRTRVPVMDGLSRGTYLLISQNVQMFQIGKTKYIIFIDVPRKLEYLNQMEQSATNKKYAAESGPEGQTSKGRS